MNKQRRKDLQRAIELLEEAKSIVEDSSTEEQAGFDNLPESLQGAERGEKMEENVSSLDEAVSSTDDAINSIQEAIDR